MPGQVRQTLLPLPAAVAVKMLTLGSSQASGAEEEEQHAKLLRQLEKEGAPGRLALGLEF